MVKKLKTLTGTLNEMATAYGPSATVESKTALKLGDNSIPKVGLDPAVVGSVFTLKKGEKKSFIGERGVVLVKMENKKIAPDIGDYTPFGSTLLQEQQQKTLSNIVPAIKERIEIEDKRYQFY